MSDWNPNPLHDPQAEYIRLRLTRAGQAAHDAVTAVEDVAVPTLSAWQRVIHTPSLRALVDPPPIKVVRHRGRHIVWDGNHRAVMATAEGRETLAAYVLDLDRPEHQQWLGEP